MEAQFLWNVPCRGPRYKGSFYSLRKKNPETYNLFLYRQSEKGLQGILSRTLVIKLLIIKGLDLSWEAWEILVEKQFKLELIIQTLVSEWSLQQVLGCCSADRLDKDYKEAFPCRDQTHLK